MNTDNFILFARSDRSKDGFYSIPGGINHVFKFQIYNRWRSNISAYVSESDQSIQTSSLRLWISRLPLGDSVFKHATLYNPLVLSTKPKTISIWDERFPDPSSECLTLDPMITYHLNIRNMQALPNRYRLILPR